MNEQNRARLDRITARHARRTGAARGEADGDAAFLTAFARVRADVLRPVMEDIGAQLEAAGHDVRITLSGDDLSPSVDFRILIADRGGSKDTIRFFPRKDQEKGWQVIGELDLKRSPIELTRFETNEQITRDVAEQILIDALEQMLSSTG